MPTITPAQRVDRTPLPAAVPCAFGKIPDPPHNLSFYHLACLFAANKSLFQLWR